MRNQACQASAERKRFICVMKGVRVPEKWRQRAVLAVETAGMGFIRRGARSRAGMQAAIYRKASANL
ncbi:hypothetical protein MyNCGM152_20100 [Achromobacter xylosoxidans]